MDRRSSRLLPQSECRLAWLLMHDHLCRYRNAQMLFSSLRALDCYATIHPTATGAAMPIPTILELQTMIEQAWVAGEPATSTTKYRVSPRLVDHLWLQRRARPGRCEALQRQTAQVDQMGRNNRNLHSIHLAWGQVSIVPGFLGMPIVQPS